MTMTSLKYILNKKKRYKIINLKSKKKIYINADEHLNV